jgi:hypothetical protein
MFLKGRPEAEIAAACEMTLEEVRDCIKNSRVKLPDIFDGLWR